MIEFIEGSLVTKSPSFAVVQTGGVALRAAISVSTYDALPKTGTTVRLWTRLHLREDELSLYGFAHPEERSLFELLIGINGIGPKLALTILSAASVDTIRTAILENDSARLKNIPRIGAKTAERIVLELRSKIGADLPAASGTTPASGSRSGSREAVDALCALGFRPVDAEKAVDEAARRGGSSTEELIKLALGVK